MEAVARAAPDGYTLVLGTPAVAINGTLYKKLAYDPLKDLTAVSLAAWGPYMVYVSGALPVSSIADLINYARARPGALNYASVGVGSGTHLVAVLFTMAAGVQIPALCTSRPMLWGRCRRSSRAERSRWSPRPHRSGSRNCPTCLR